MKKRNLSGLVMYSYSKDGAFKTAQQLKGIHRFKLVSERGRELVKGGVGVGAGIGVDLFFLKNAVLRLALGLETNGSNIRSDHVTRNALAGRNIDA